VEALRLRCLLLGPALAIIGVALTLTWPRWAGMKQDLGWQVYALGPALILGGAALFWVGYRSRPAPQKERKEAAKEVAIDAVVNTLLLIAILVAILR
jgi:hypothetical protein